MASNIKPMAPAFNQQHKAEKEHLGDLNERMKIYCAHAANLEKQNQKLSSELVNLKNNWGSNTRNVIEKMEPQLLDARNKLDELSINQLDALADAQRLENLREIIQDDLKSELNAKNQDKTKISNLEKDLEKTINEVNELRKLYDQQLVDLKKIGHDKKELKDELAEQSNRLYDTKKNNSKLKALTITLEEQISFLKAVHEHELAEMKRLKGDKVIDPNQFYHQELKRAIHDIRQDFNELSEAEKREREAWAKAKTDELEKMAKKQNAGVDDLDAIRDLNKELKDEINKNNNLIKELNNLNKNLRDKLAKLEKDLEDLKRENGDHKNEKDKLIAAIKEKIQELLDDYDQILHTKGIHDAEVNTLKRLLDKFNTK